MRVRGTQHSLRPGTSYGSNVYRVQSYLSRIPSTYSKNELWWKGYYHLFIDSSTIPGGRKIISLQNDGAYITPYSFGLLLTLLAPFYPEHWGNYHCHTLFHISSCRTQNFNVKRPLPITGATMRRTGQSTSIQALHSVVPGTLDEDDNYSNIIGRSKMNG